MSRFQLHSRSDPASQFHLHSGSSVWSQQQAAARDGPRVADALLHTDRHTDRHTDSYADGRRYGRMPGFAQAAAWGVPACGTLRHASDACGHGSAVCRGLSAAADPGQMLAELCSQISRRATLCGVNPMVRVGQGSVRMLGTRSSPADFLMHFGGDVRKQADRTVACDQ